MDTPDALDEFAIEDPSLIRSNGGAPAEVDTGGESPILTVGVAEVCANSHQPLSRIEEREARRRSHRRSPVKRLAAETAAATRDAAGTVARSSVRRAQLSRRAVRRVAVRMRRRSNASEARLRSEREAAARVVRRAGATLRGAISTLAGRSVETTVRLALAMRLGAAAATHMAASAVRRAAVAVRGTAVHLAERAADTTTRLRPVLRSAAARAGEQLRRVSNMAERMWPAARDGGHLVHGVVVRTWSRGVAAATSASARPFSAFERQELGGFVVALVLSVSVVGYGALLVMSWGDGVEYPVARAAAVLPVPAPVPATSSLTEPVAGQPAIAEDPAMGRPLVQTVAAVERRASAPTARTLTALWQRRDTRSLDRAFTMLRQETLAFRNCGVRMTDADRAVARCQGSGRSWTIDFQRRGGRWAMTRVVSR